MYSPKAFPSSVANRSTTSGVAGGIPTRTIAVGFFEPLSNIDYQLDRRKEMHGTKEVESSLLDCGT